MASWLDVIDQLYENSWSPDLHRFRSTYAFRGLPTAQHTLTGSLHRLAAGHTDVRRLELALLRNFRK
jgi:hypothetical protein